MVQPWLPDRNLNRSLTSFFSAKETDVLTSLIEILLHLFQALLHCTHDSIYFHIWHHHTTPTHTTPHHITHQHRGSFSNHPHATLPTSLPENSSAVQPWKVLVAFWGCRLTRHLHFQFNWELSHPSLIISMSSLCAQSINHLLFPITCCLQILNSSWVVDEVETDSYPHTHFCLLLSTHFSF